ncbi:MAG: DUF4910 domain-containing protein [Armatimonadota bacterium]|nr:DUF4910 domain-containing protein [Armatimonadota bacterium]
MVDELLKRVSEVFDGDAAYRSIEELVRWNRLPTSQDLHTAMLWAADQLRGWGLEVELDSYPTDGSRMYWSYVTPPRWECKEGWLERVTPGGRERLADWSVQPLCVIQRSVSTGGIVKGELVAIESEAEADAAGESLKGKIVLSSAPAESVVRWCIRRYGAAGIITDSMSLHSAGEIAAELEDALQWTLFPYTRGKPLEAWGFVVSPSVGRKLREECSEGTVRLRAKVDVRTGRRGKLDQLTAFLPGTGPQEIWMIAHLCHPAPFANDNASGAAVLLECARTIAALLREEKIPPLRRGIRFLFPVEIAGTIAHLSSHPELQGRAIAGLNLDMVGSSQDKSGTVLCIDRPPDAAPSCLPELLELLYERVEGQTTGLSGSSRYPLFRYTTTHFSGGSDHWVLSDPSVGIPTPMLIEWPDRTYHTTADTLDNIDVRTLRRNGVVAASYALFLAAAGAEEAEWLGDQALGRFVSEMGRMLGRTAEHQREYRRWNLFYLTERRLECLKWLRVLRPEGGAWSRQGSWRTYLHDLYRTLCPIHDDNDTVEPESEIYRSEAGSWILEWIYPGPISHYAHLGTLPEEEQEAFRQLCADHPWASKTYYKHITHWIDGDRTLAEMAGFLAVEIGRRDDVFLIEYVKLLERLGLVHVVRGRVREE